jgi:hypothetical protein
MESRSRAHPGPGNVKPRAISAIKTRREYRPDWSRFAVYLDDVIVKDCIFASEVEGRVAKAVEDGIGNLIVNDAGTGPRVNEHRGVVRIERTSLPLTDRYSEAFLKVFSNDHKLLVAQ